MKFKNFFIKVLDRFIVGLLLVIVLKLLLLINKNTNCSDVSTLTVSVEKNYK